MKSILILAVGFFVFGQNSFAGDIAFYGVAKGQSFFQTTNATPSLDGSTPYSFQCFVDSTGPDLILDASVQLPSSASRVLQPDGSQSFSFQASFSTLSALNSTYGNGTYSLTIDSENDLNFVQLSMPADNYPTTPQLTNYTAAQTINPSNSFTAVWQPFVGGTTSDFVEFQIRNSSDNTVFSSGELGTPGALNGTNLSIAIPANTLSPGETYRGQLMFARVTTRNTSSISGATGIVGFLKRTGFDLKTTGIAPVINLNVIGVTNGNFQFSFPAQPGKNYQVQYTSTLTNWTDIGFFTATTNQIIFSDSFTSFNAPRFYRVSTP